MTNFSKCPAKRTIGTYALILHSEPENQQIGVGALGRLNFKEGYYCYGGSALSGIEARLKRHIKIKGKKKHWHIDYLREKTRFISAIAWPTSIKKECSLSQKISDMSEDYIPNFGCSDCHCSSHLFHFKNNPTGEILKQRLGGEPGKITDPRQKVS